MYECNDKNNNSNNNKHNNDTTTTTTNDNTNNTNNSTLPECVCMRSFVYPHRCTLAGGSF